ncbi:MAG: HD domain-containing protein [Candidatus Micrarchaeota archaeon]
MIIKDEIHGTLDFDELEGRIIDSAPFQRLRRIRQMSITNLVYPGANHTRFEHSLGTAHLASVIAERVGLDEDIVRKVKIYALLHDIGHTAFSHEGEDVLSRHIGDHESLGRERILSGEIADILSESYKPREIADIGSSPYGSIITSDIGSDRMDYLKRDALNTGVAYGIIDIDRLVHTMAMRDGELCVEKGGLEAAEYLLVARFMMFSAVYMHKTVRIATAMLYRAIEGAIEDGTVPAGRFAELDDEGAFALMLGSRRGGFYASSLRDRKLFKEVCSIPASGLDESKAKRMEDSLSEKTGQRIIVDFPHRFFKPVGFKVHTEGGLRPISELSGLVQSLKKAEEDRMRALVLSEEDVRKKEGKRIIRLSTTGKAR